METILLTVINSIKEIDKAEIMSDGLHIEANYNGYSFEWTAIHVHGNYIMQGFIDDFREHELLEMPFEHYKKVYAYDETEEEVIQSYRAYMNFFEKMDLVACMVECILKDLQEKMYERLESTIEKLKKEKKINLVEYVISIDVLFELTDNHCDIYENNIAQKLIYDEESFIEGLETAYLSMKEEYPDIDNWTHDEINEISAGYADYVWA